MTRTLDDSTYASDPGGIRLSHRKLQRFHPELFNRNPILEFFKPARERASYLLTYIEEHLLHGDSRAAVVISTEPLLIAAYTDEFDCVAMLNFPQMLVREYKLVPSMHLLTVNTYSRGSVLQPDLTPGPGLIKRWNGFAPFIAEFLSDDIERIRQRRQDIPLDEWDRTLQLGNEYYARHGLFARDGSPLKAQKPAQRLPT